VRPPYVEEESIQISMGKQGWLWVSVLTIWHDQVPVLEHHMEAITESTGGDESWNEPHGPALCLCSRIKLNSLDPYPYPITCFYSYSTVISLGTGFCLGPRVWPKWLRILISTNGQTPSQENRKGKGAPHISGSQKAGIKDNLHLSPSVNHAPKLVHRGLDVGYE
jgi:hypothetical protein